MLRTGRLGFVFAGILVLAICALTTSRRSWRASAQTATPTTVKDIDGHSYRLFVSGTGVTVLFFVTVDCPITNSYMPEMRRIATAYAPRKIAFFAVYSDPSLTVSAIRHHAADFGLDMPAIDDTAHVLVRKAGATVNPEAALFANGGQVVYRGRIDNWYVDLGLRRAAATEHYLRRALDETLSGKPVTTAEVPPVGCSIVP
jgi:hypothetical protein